MDKLYKSIETTLKNNQKIKLIGCNHGNWNIESDFKPRRKFYESEIEKSDFIILEQIVGAEFYDDKEFFDRIGELALKHNKEIYILDPVNNKIYLRNMENFQQHIENGSDLKYIETTNIDDFQRHKDTFDVFDYRNIKIGQRLNQDISKINFDYTIAIHGASHTLPIHFYLHHNKERDEKLKLIYPNLETLTRKIKKFTPNKHLNIPWEKSFI